MKKEEEKQAKPFILVHGEPTGPLVDPPAVEKPKLKDDYNEDNSPASGSEESAENNKALDIPAESDVC